MFLKIISPKKRCVPRYILVLLDGKHLQIKILYFLNQNYLENSRQLA